MSMWARAKLSANDLRALEQRYAGLRFTQAEARWFDETPNDSRWVSDGTDEFTLHINIVGSAETLLKHGFIRRKWMSLPPCGVRHHRTKGFGWGTVKRRKSGGLLVNGHYYDALDKIAPVLVAPLLERFKRSPTKLDRTIAELRKLLERRDRGDAASSA